MSNFFRSGGSTASAAFFPSAPIKHPLGGSSSDPIKSSQGQSPPERIDVNQLINRVGVPPAQTLGDQYGIAGSVADAGLGLFGAAGVAPAFTQERPLAALQTIGKHVFNADIGQNNPLGQLLGGIGDALGGPGRWVASSMNASTAEVLSKYKDKPDDFRPGVLGMGITMGELRKINYEKGAGGFTVQDLQDIANGKSIWEYGDKMLSSNPVVDMAARLAYDPVTWATFAAPGIGLGAKLFGFKELVQTGVILERAVPVARAAEAVAAGVSREVTLAGLGRYAANAARTTAYRAISTPGLIRATEGGFSAAKTAGKLISANQKIGIGLSVAEIGIRQAHEVIGPQSGFLEDLYNFNEELLNNHPWSDNTQFMMISGLNFHYMSKIGAVKQAVKGSKYALAGSATEARVIEKLAPAGMAADKAKAYVLKRIGGQEVLNELVDHVHMSIAYKKIAPRLKSLSEASQSSPELAIKLERLHELVTDQVKVMRTRDQFSTRDTVEALEEWFTHRTRGTDVLNNVAFPWSGDMAISQWVEYRKVAEPIGRVLRDQVVGIAQSLGSNTGLPVLGLTDIISAEAYRATAVSLESHAVNGIVPNEAIREALRKTPQLASRGSKKANAFWERFLSDASLDGDLRQINRMISSGEKNAPRVSQPMLPAARAEAEAMRADLEAALVEPQPANGFAEAPTQSVRASTYKPSDYGVSPDVSGALRDGLTPRAVRVRNNLVDALKRVGFDAKGARSVIVGVKNKVGTETILRTSSMDEMRVAATLVGRTTGAASVDVVVTGERLVAFGLKPNAFEIVYQLPDAVASKLQGVSRVLSQRFEDFTINAETGFVRITAKGADATELKKLLDGEIRDALRAHYPTDAAGFDGISRSTNPAYIERIGRAKSADLQYRTVASTLKSDPRWSTESAIRDWVGAPGPAIGESGGALGGVGSAAAHLDPLRMPGHVRAAYKAAGATDTEIAGMDALTAMRASQLGVTAEDLWRNVDVVFGESAPPGAALQSLTSDIEALSPQAAAKGVEEILSQKPPEWLVKEGAGHADAAPLEKFTFDGGVTRRGLHADAAAPDSIFLPGGLEGEWSVWDATRVRAQMINTRELYNLDPEFTQQLYQKMFRSQVRDLADPMETFRLVTFALTSPQTDFILNEGRSLAMRMSTPEEIISLANKYEAKAGVVEKGDRAGQAYKAGSPDSIRALGREVAADYGLTGDLKGMDEHFGNIVLSAKMFREHPELFTLQAGQDINQFSERLMNMTRGAGLKVGTFGPMLANPVMGTRGTIDVHMVRFINNFMKEHRVFLEGEEVARGFKKGYLTDALPLDAKGEPIIPGARNVTFRLADGTINPAVPKYLHDLEPMLKNNKIDVFTDSAYERANAILAIDQELSGTGRYFDLGGHQWMRWDIQRGGRLEPHVAVYPGTYAMSKGAVVKGAAGRNSIMESIDNLRKSGYSKTGAVEGHYPTPESILAFQHVEPKLASGVAVAVEGHGNATFVKVVRSGEGIEEYAVRLDTGAVISVEPWRVKGLAAQKVGRTVAGWTAADGTRTVMGLTKHANASTALHEMWHGVLEPSLTSAERAVLETHGAVGEAGARMWERWLYDGVTSVPELDALFTKIKDMMQAVYSKLKGSPIEAELHPEVRATFDSMFGRAPGPPNVSAAEAVGSLNAVEGAAKGRWWRNGSKGVLYHATPVENLQSIASEGLKANPPSVGQGGRVAWREGGVGKRTWFSRSPESAALASRDVPDKAILRLKAVDAGVPLDAPGTAPGTAVFSTKGVPASMIEVLGKDEKWYPLTSFFEKPLGDVPPTLHPARATLEAINKEVSILNQTDHLTAATTFESDAAAAARRGTSTVPDPVGTPSHMSPVEYTQANGGATIDIATGQPHDFTSGFGVSVAEGTAELVPVGNEAALAAAIKRVGQKFGTKYVGTWEDGGFYHVDPSRVVGSYEEAQRLGAQFKQDSIFNFASGESMKVQTALQDAIDLAIRDAMVVQQNNMPLMKLSSEWAHAPEEVQRVVQAWDSLIRAEMPGYEVRVLPKTGLIEKFGASDVAATNNAALGALKVRDGIAQWLTVSGPLAPVTKLMDWLVSPVANGRLTRQATDAMVTEFVAAGATSADTLKFIKNAKNRVKGATVLNDLQMYADISHAPPHMITAAAVDSFPKELVAKIGEGNFYKLVDRAANRFTRTAIQAKATGTQQGRLSRALDTMYGQWQDKAPAVRNLKVYYHMFRFLMDPRWHFMNKFEADVLGQSMAGEGKAAASAAGPGTAYAGHAPGGGARAVNGETGWFYTRHLEGTISRSFNKAAALNARDAADEVISAAGQRATRDALNGIEASQWGELRRMFPDANSSDDIAAQLSDQLYKFDHKGVKGTADDILNADQTQFARDMQAEEMQPILQKLYEANQKEFDTITNVFEGNHSRTNMERIGNSYFLYWPLSYQLKATKWLWDVATSKMGGVRTGALGAATYTQVLKAHQKGMTTDPEYAAMFNDHPAMWFLAQQLLPITPFDLGVSLSRPVRYGVNMALNAIDPNRKTDGNPLGFWGDYKAAQNIGDAALGLTNMGPIYTLGQAQKLWLELQGKRSFTVTTDNTPPGIQPSKPMTQPGITFGN